MDQVPMGTINNYMKFDSEVARILEQWGVRDVDQNAITQRPADINTTQVTCLNKLFPAAKNKKHKRNHRK